MVEIVHLPIPTPSQRRNRSLGCHIKTSVVNLNYQRREQAPILALMIQGCDFDCIQVGQRVCYEDISLGRIPHWARLTEEAPSDNPAGYRVFRFTDLGPVHVRLDQYVQDKARAVHQWAVDVLCADKYTILENHRDTSELLQARMRSDMMAYLDLFQEEHGWEGIGGEYAEDGDRLVPTCDIAPELCNVLEEVSRRAHYSLSGRSWSEYQDLINEIRDGKTAEVKDAVKEDIHEVIVSVRRPAAISLSEYQKSRQPSGWER